MRNILKYNQPFRTWLKDIALSPIYAVGAIMTGAAVAFNWARSEKSGNQVIGACVNTVKGGWRLLDTIALRTGLKGQYQKFKQKLSDRIDEFADKSPRHALAVKIVATAGRVAMAVVKSPVTLIRAIKAAPGRIANSFRIYRQNSRARREAELDVLRQMNSPQGRFQSKVSFLQGQLADLAQDNPSFGYSLEIEPPVQGVAPVAKLFTNLTDAQGNEVIFRINPNSIEMGSGGQVSQVFRSAAKAMEHIRTHAPRERHEPKF